MPLRYILFHEIIFIFGLLLNFAHAEESVSPGQQKIVIYILEQTEYEFLKSGILPRILTEQGPADGRVRFKLSVKNRVVDPVFIDAELWLLDGSGRRISLSNNSAAVGLDTFNPVGARILADISHESLLPLADGVYTLSAMIEWSDKNIHTFMSDISIRGFKEAERLEIKGDRAEIDITMLFKLPKVDSFSVPLQFCLLPQSTQYASVYTLEKTELSHTVDRGVTLPYKMELVVADSFMTMPIAVLTQGQPVMVPSLEVLYERGLSKNVRCIDYRLVFSLSEKPRKNIMSGFYRQNQTIVLSQSI